MPIKPLAFTARGLGSLLALALSQDPAQLPVGPAPPAPGPPGQAEVLTGEDAPYRRCCQRCHGPDGKGGRTPRGLANLPDFSDPAWQVRRSDTQLLVSILEGKGTGMPGFREKVEREQAEQLVAYVRSFCPRAARAASAPRGPGGFEAHFHRLLEEFQDLQRQFQELSAGPPRP